MRRLVGPTLAAALLVATLLSAIRTGPVSPAWAYWNPSPQRVALAFAALGGGGFGGSSSGNQSFSGTKLFTDDVEFTQGKNITFDGATGAKKLSSDGTTLTLTGLTLSVDGILPITDQVPNIGSTAKNWGYAYVAALRDQVNGNNRIRIFANDVTQVLGSKANSGTNVAVQIGNTASLDGTTRIACFYADNTLTTEAFCVGNDGTLVANTLKVPVVHGTGTAAQAIEVGSGAMTSGSLTVTFGTAFGAAPKCSCTHVTTTNTNPCDLSTTVPTTSQAIFTVASGGTDVVHWTCIGQR